MDLAIDKTSSRNSVALADSGFAGFGLRPVTRVSEDRQLLARRRMGKIITEGGQVLAITGRWWPYSANLARVWWDQRFGSLRGNRCELYYHQSGGFLTLSYVHSGPGTTLSTLYAATLVLDEIARLKSSVAIVCHVTNRRISNRFFHRWGWQEHCLAWSGRHFIKRFYDGYPPIGSVWRKRLGLD